MNFERFTDRRLFFNPAIVKLCESPGKAGGLPLHLAAKIVASDFWPSCENCQLYKACKGEPQHPAFPHSWHWGKEGAEFADGTLILRSWVGTAVIGQPHTGCKSYTVDAHHVSEPAAHQRLYLELEHERSKLEGEMETLERRKKWTRNEEDRHAAWFKRYRRILAEQIELRAVVIEAQPFAAAVNQ